MRSQLEFYFIKPRVLIEFGYIQERGLIHCLLLFGLKVTQINYVSRNQLHSTEFLLSTFEFERQNIAKDVNKLFVFSSVLTQNMVFFSVFSVAY